MSEPVVPPAVLEQAREQVAKIREALGLSKSVMASGEAYSEQVAKVIGEAIAAVDPLGDLLARLARENAEKDERDEDTLAQMQTMSTGWAETTERAEAAGARVAALETAAREFLDAENAMWDRGSDRETDMRIETRTLGARNALRDVLAAALVGEQAAEPGKDAWKLIARAEASAEEFDRRSRDASLLDASVVARSSENDDTREEWRREAETTLRAARELITGGKVIEAEHPEWFAEADDLASEITILLGFEASSDDTREAARPTPRVDFTEIDENSEYIRSALRKLPLHDDDRRVAAEALGFFIHKARKG